MKRNVTLLTLAVYLIFCLFCTTAMAADDDGSLINKIKEASKNENNIVEKADQKGYKAVMMIRSIAFIAAVLFLAWAGLILLGGGGDSRKMADVKGKLIGFFLALIFIFLAEEIVATIIEFLGVELP